MVSEAETDCVQFRSYVVEIPEKDVRIRGGREETAICTKTTVMKACFAACIEHAELLACFCVPQAERKPRMSHREQVSSGMIGQWPRPFVVIIAIDAKDDVHGFEVPRHVLSRGAGNKSFAVRRKNDINFWFVGFQGLVRESLSTLCIPQVNASRSTPRGCRNPPPIRTQLDMVQVTMWADLNRFFRVVHVDHNAM